LYVVYPDSTKYKPFEKQSRTIPPFISPQQNPTSNQNLKMAKY
jgi:hypothetical protein